MTLEVLAIWAKMHTLPRQIKQHLMLCNEPPAECFLCNWLAYWL
jgi:hypothetical protein